MTKFVCFSSTKDFSNAKTKIQATSEKGQSACHETIKNSEQLPFSGNNDLIEFGSCNDIGGNRCDTKNICVIHHSSHRKLSNCYTFCKMSIPERREVVKSNGLCFKCFGQHVVRVFSSSVQCQRCNQNHHTMLQLQRHAVQCCSCHQHTFKLLELSMYNTKNEGDLYIVYLLFIPS